MPKFGRQIGSGMPLFGAVMAGAVGRACNAHDEKCARVGARGSRLGWFLRCQRFVHVLLLAFVAVGPAWAAPWAWEDFPGYRRAPLAKTESRGAGFEVLGAEETGMQFTNLLAEYRSLTNQLFFNGSGVAAGDVDGDGWCDVYWCGLDNGNRLYRNLGGWKFEDITGADGLACEDMASTGAALADLDGDGDLDLVVNSLGNGTRLFANDGRGQFTLKGEVNPNRGGMSLALGDVDGDGALDLYIANYRKSALVDMPDTHVQLRNVNGRQEVWKINGQSASIPEFANRFRYSQDRGVTEDGELDLFLRNLGQWRFESISIDGRNFSDADGRPLAGPLYEWGLSVMMRDIDQDGKTDLYVCNDFDSEDRVWLNQGQGKFRELSTLAMRKSCHFSMGVDFADLNADGHDDFMVLDMMSRDHERHLSQMNDTRPPIIHAGPFDNRPDYVMNMLYLNRGDGTYAEIAQLSGVEAAEWAWAVIFLDVDLDGYPDILITNGQGRASRDKDVAALLKKMRTEKEMSPHDILMARRLFGSLPATNIVFRNQGDLTFEDQSAAWGFDHYGFSHGMALADLDNDGDQDVLVNHLAAPAGVYRNASPAARVAVQLRGKAPNTQGIGARIRVRAPGMPDQAQEMMAGGRYLSSDQPMRSFAAGSETNLVTLEVDWPGGGRSVLSGVPAQHVYLIEETQETAQDQAGEEPGSQLAKPGATPFFEDVSDRISHEHVDRIFNDHERQYLLPHRLSQAGPGVSWFDWDLDGDEDLIVGSGKGGVLGAFRNEGQGRFERITERPFAAPVTRDQTTVLGWVDPQGAPRLLAGSANYEDGLSLGGSVRSYELGDGAVKDLFPGRADTTGPLAMADVDGDDDLDLFVGGRVRPGRYPMPASSALWIHERGEWKEDGSSAGAWAELGLVQGAVFSDLDDDGDPDLVLACDWGPIRVWRNEGGDWTEATSDYGLDEYRGWWTGVNTGDFDGDGRMDIVVGNWGRNTPYEAHRERPLQLVYGDFDENGTVDLIEAHYDSGMGKYVPRHQLEYISYGIPLLGAKYNSHRAYARAGVDEILGETKANAGVVSANWLETTLFLNRGSRFEARALPVQAQMAPVFGVSVGDLDGDGREDLFLSQNFFSVFPRMPRFDAGRGLWLRGDGQGNFAAEPGSRSGIVVYGEQRGSALSDFDGDGCLDVAVAQNAAATKLYWNRGAAPGLRVRLRGPAGNRDGIGVRMRMAYEDRKGPVREVHAGAGYWSQDGAVQVLGGIEGATHVEVRWPGRDWNRHPIEPGQKEITVDGR